MEKKHILVIGGAGYIGSHMVKCLLGAQYPVVVVDNLSTGYVDSLRGGTFIKAVLVTVRLWTRCLKPMILVRSCILLHAHLLENRLAIH